MGRQTNFVISPEILRFWRQVPTYMSTQARRELGEWADSKLSVSKLTQGLVVSLQSQCRMQKGKELNDFQRIPLEIEILSNLRFGSLELRDTSVTRVTNKYSWTIPSGTWTRRRAHFKGESEQLVQLFNSDRLRQETLEKDGHHTPTWSVL